MSNGLVCVVFAVRSISALVALSFQEKPAQHQLTTFCSIKGTECRRYLLKLVYKLVD